MLSRVNGVRSSDVKTQYSFSVLVVVLYALGELSIGEIMLWRGHVLLLLSVFLGSSTSFRCHVCSYSSNTDHNTDCIDNLESLTAPGNFYRCNRTCVIQENYSLEERKVTSYMRTCSAVEKDGFCVKDTWNLVCYHSCLGELCNNYQGFLHQQYPVRGEQYTDADSMNSNNGASRTLRAQFLFRVLLFTFLALTARLL